MKIPLDFFLRLVQKMANSLKLEDLNKAIKNHLELPEDAFVRKKEYNFISNFRLIL